MQFISYMSKQIRLTAKIDGEPYFIARFLTIIRYKILMLSGF